MGFQVQPLRRGGSRYVRRTKHTVPFVRRASDLMRARTLDLVLEIATIANEFDVVLIAILTCETNLEVNFMI